MQGDLNRCGHLFAPNRIGYLETPTVTEPPNSKPNQNTAKNE
jgi:hypothetical protein